MTDEVAELAPRLRRFSVEIDATPGAVHDCWSRFEEFPRFRTAVLRVNVSPLPSSRTRLELCLNYQPSRFLARVADAFGWIDAGIRRDLRRFGRFAERATARRQL